MIFHFPLEEFDRSEDEKNTEISRTLIRRFALLAAAAAASTQILSRPFGFKLSESLAVGSHTPFCRSADRCLIEAYCPKGAALTALAVTAAASRSGWKKKLFAKDSEG